MTSFTQFRTLNYSAKQIYDLVIDVEKYPKFLPWCQSAKIIEIVSEQNFHADLVANFKGFIEKYRSDVIFYEEDEHFYVEAKAINGPFKELINIWKINKIDENLCEVEFFVNFEFNSFMLQKVAGIFFDKAAHKMMESFERRAGELYNIS